MIPEMGESALLTACFLSLFLPAMGLWLENGRKVVWVHSALLRTVSQSFMVGLLGISFLCLVYSFITCDLRVLAVANNCHTDMSFFYRLGATWGHHEGSMLLFILIFTLYGFNYKNHRPLLWHWFFLSLFLFYILMVSNPFDRIFFPFPQGAELNPLLQDPLLVIHPPILYAGYAGCVVPFCLALTQAWQPMPSSTYYTDMRSAILMAWGFLTLGIALGSLWAYYELGWGGWWFWDPVENASLLPWLMATLLLHLLHGVKHRPAWSRGIMYAAFLTYILALGGLFLVRSGLLSSVHSFAFDPQRGRFLAGIMGLSVVMAVVSLFKETTRKNVTSGPLSLRDRSFFYGIAILLWAVMTFTILLGTLYPLVLKGLNLREISVGAPYFKQTVVPMGLLSLVPMGIVLGYAWQPLPGSALFQRLQHFFIVTLSLALGLGYTFGVMPFAQTLGVFLSGIIIASVFVRPTKWPLKLGHGGFALMVIGMCLDTGLYQEDTLALKVGESRLFKEATLSLKAIESGKGPTYTFERAQLSYTQAKTTVLLEPEKRYYASHRTLTTETAIHAHFLSHVYVVLGGLLPDGRWVIRISTHPWVSLIWIGALLMAVGAFIKIINIRRKRKE